VIFLRPEGGLRLSEALPDRTGSVENAVLADGAVGVRNRSLEIADLGSEIRDLRFQVSTAALRALAAGGSRRWRPCSPRLAEAGVAQLVERVLGKDEVSGSNPDTSSIKKDKSGNREQGTGKETFSRPPWRPRE
jgi:hypothetical protein